MKQLQTIRRRGRGAIGANGKATNRSLPALYEQDETAWLEIMADLCLRRDYQVLDLRHLGEYLADMAKRDRREVLNRLETLLVHLLKWEFQPNKQTASWKGTILEQRRQLRHLVASKTLMNHAVNVLADAYADARKQAAVETQMKASKFPKECPWGLDGILSED
jgi:hypothetical protein